MKKLLSAVFTAASLILCAGYDFPIDGKFRNIKDNLPAEWVIADPGNAKIVRGEHFFTRALELTAGTTAVQAVSRRSFPVTNLDFIEVEAEVKGQGNAFLAVELLNARGQSVATAKISVRPAGRKFAGFKGKLRVADYAKLAPASAKIIIGAEAGAKVAFYDVEAESDND